MSGPFAKNATNGTMIHERFRDMNESVQVLLVFVVISLLLAALFFVDKYWKQRQTENAKATGLLNTSHSYATNLVKHFMPTMKVAKYQFRGMHPPPAKVDIAFHKLGLELHSGTKVLTGVTGEFLAGRMCAIMGPSGAGKTTFMNVLCGKATYGKMTGTILINGYKFDISQINSVVGFVPQDDVVHETLTVREQIAFSATLRNKVGTSPARIGYIVDDILNVMQIDHIQNSIVGGVEKRGISGGQRKRVNIGLELAAQPTVLFLDEPTSGLDSTSSLAVVYSLKKMCQLGMTCIMVIHQPRYSLFTLFDDVLLLGKGGNTVYLGESAGAKTYFDDLGFLMLKDENRADWFMDVISGEVPNERIPNFEPKMLFDLWEKYKGGTPPLEGSDALDEEAGITGGQTLGSRTRAGRDMTNEEEIAVLTRSLHDEWDYIDLNYDGFLDSEELKALLTRCSQLEPSDEVVNEVLRRMAGPDKAVVEKAQFIRYLCSLQGDIAKDMLAIAESGGTQGGTDGFRDGVRQVFLSVLPQGMKEQVTDSDNDSGSEESSMSEDSTSETWTSKPKNGIAALQRTIPGPCLQFRILFTRTLIQWWRKNNERMIFFIAMALGAVILAGQDILCAHPRWDAMALVNTHTCVGLLTTIFCLNVFGENQPMFWRERNRGMSVFSFFQAKTSLNLCDLWMQCFLFTSLYYGIRVIHVPFLDYWVPYLLTTYAASGWGYAISAWLPAQHGPFVGSLIIFVVCGLLGNPMSLTQFLANPMLEAVVDIISITRWSIPMSFYLEIEAYPPVPDGIQEEMTLGLYKAAYSAASWPNPDYGHWYPGLIILILYGLTLRLIAYLGLLFKNRDKMV